MKLRPEVTPSHFTYGEPLTGDQRRQYWPRARPDVMLWRTLEDGRREKFVLLSSIAYQSQAFGTTITVPAKFDEFATDLTSVPTWFTWLVPKSGTHLPAALVHDGLVPNADDQGPTYTTDPHCDLDRLQADRVFRDAMRDSEVGLIRSWLVWAAVCVASLWAGPRADTPRREIVFYRALTILTFGVIAVLGYAATIDLLDWDWWPAFDVPWMYEGGLLAELYTGFAGAVVIPLVLAIAWWRHYWVAAIAGVAVATLFHATVAVAAVAIAYQGAERLLNLGRRSSAFSIAVWVVVGVVVVTCAVSVITMWVD